MTFPDDPNRPLGTDRPLETSRPYDNERSPQMAWSAIVVIAILVIGGFLFYNSSANRTTTASTDSGAWADNTGSSPDTQAVDKRPRSGGASYHCPSIQAALMCGG